MGWIAPICHISATFFTAKTVDSAAFALRERVGVAHGCGDVGVSHQLFHGDEIDPAEDKPGCERVSQVVEPARGNP